MVSPCSIEEWYLKRNEYSIYPRALATLPGLFSLPRKKSAGTSAALSATLSRVALYTCLPVYMHTCG